MRIKESTKGEKHLLFVEIAEDTEYMCEGANVQILFKLSKATEADMAAIVRKTNFGIPQPKIKWCNYINVNPHGNLRYDLESAKESFESLLVAEGVRGRATAMPTVFHTDVEYNGYVEGIERYNQKDWIVLEISKKYKK